ncbi:MAG: alpha/beta fold hydrolase [Deltaproteobacteria bacterium]|nr:alpha/beta fold hydrolase [Deltaproteobacteria bacterium]
MYTFLRGASYWAFAALALSGCEPVTPRRPGPTAATAPPAVQVAPDAGPPPAAPPRPSAAEASSPPADVGVAFVERMTGGAAPEAPAPLVVVVHGLGDTPESFVELFEGLPFPARVVAVRGLDPFGDGWAWFPSGDADRLPAAFDRAVEALARALPALASRRPTCGLPVVVGFSQGAMLSFALAARHPTLLRAAAPIAGRLPRAVGVSPGALRRPEVVALHGTADDRIPFSRGQAAVALLRANGYPASMFRAEGVGHTINGPMARHLTATLQRWVGGGCAP